MGGTNLNFMDKIFTGASQTTTFSPSKISRYTVPFQKDVCLTKWCDCSTSYLELNLAIALVIAESHYASGVIVALLLEGVIITKHGSSIFVLSTGRSFSLWLLLQL